MSTVTVATLMGLIVGGAIALAGMWVATRRIK